MMISAYQFGSIEIDGRRYTSDLIITPEQVFPHWWRKQGHSLCIDDLRRVLLLEPELLVVGTGYHGRMGIPRATLNILQDRGIRVESDVTGNAVQRFNGSQTRYARIAAALHLTC